MTDRSAAFDGGPSTAPKATRLPNEITGFEVGTSCVAVPALATGMKFVCGGQPGSGRNPKLHVLRTKICEPEVPPATRFVALDAKAMTAPSAPVEGVTLSPPVAR